jgi:hypothetical protein
MRKKVSLFILKWGGIDETCSMKRDGKKFLEIVRAKS